MRSGRSLPRFDSRDRRIMLPRLSANPSQRDLFASLLTLLAVTSGPSLQLLAQDGIRRIPGAAMAFDCPAVIVTGRELLHTTQLLPVDEQGELVGANDVAQQVERVFRQLEIVLKEEHTDVRDTVKLNLYLADEAALPAVEQALELRFPSGKPAVSLVTTSLPIRGAIVAADAVAARETGADPDRRAARNRVNNIAGRERMAHSAVMPVGETIYISGQAEPGDNLADATKKTLAGLKKTLDHLGLGLEHVVQLKCFLQPMSDIEQTYAEIEELFGDQLAPPTSVVEWISSLPIEIEMVVHSPQASATDAITHEWLSWLTVSPVYCRYSRIPGDTQIYISGCFGAAETDDSAQVATVFQQLQDRLTAAGSDLKHMAKATYYVSTDAASTAVNEIRPTLYDSQHPPAASKALVQGVGLAGRTFTLDMIAAPAQ